MAQTDCKCEKTALSRGFPALIIGKSLSQNKGQYGRLSHRNSVSMKKFLVNNLLAALGLLALFLLMDIIHMISVTE